MGITRRSLLQLVGGAGLGVMVSPLPWKLLDDVSIWTQNWSLTPKLVRGETSKRYATCGLCGGGCGIVVRMLDDVPIAVKGLDSHPTSHGGACPLGLGAPQLRFHPCRIAKPVMRGAGGELAATTPKEAIATIGAQVARAVTNPSAGKVAFLDRRPGSAMSALYRSFLGRLGDGFYLTPPGAQTALAGAMFGEGHRRLGYDLETTKTVLSFSAPLFEGFDSPGRMAGVARLWNAAARKDRPRLIHADPNHSTTASMADTWLPIKHGSEAALALGIGHLLLKNNLIDKEATASALDLAEYTKLVEGFGPKKVSGLTGLDTKELVAVAKRVAVEAPSIAVAGGGAGEGPLGLEEETAVMALNLLLGSVGKAGGLLPLATWPPAPAQVSEPVAEPEPEPERPESAESRFKKKLEEIPNGSIGLLIVDGSMPETALARGLLDRKLAKQSMTVSLWPYLAGSNLRADVVLPTTVVGEWEHDVFTPAGLARSTYSIARKLAEAPPGIKPPSEIVRLIAKAGGVELGGNPFENAIKDNLEAIIASGRGTVFEAKSGKTEAIDKYNSADKLREVLVNGGCWVDHVAPFETARKTRLLGSYRDGGKSIAVVGQGRAAGLQGSPGEYPLVLMPFGRRGDAGESAVPQLMTKLYRESGLCQLFMNAHVNPETGAKQRVSNGKKARLNTPAGSIEVDVVWDEKVAPGVVRVAVGPSPLSMGDVEKGQFTSVLDIAQISRGGVWRLTRASLEEVRHA
ncbi:MAG: molybdopterin-dependent oxidoreductase [Deltaproteobacteria bacterium]|nr:molybdopterin-dependent oxidoreductase [Deltaproteobacteria bacterium]